MGGVLVAGEVAERADDVGGDDLVVGAAEVVEELAVAFEQLGRCIGTPVSRPDVDAEEITVAALGHASGPADELFTGRGAGEGDDDSFTGFPGPVDPVLVAVAQQRLVDLVGDPEQRQLPQCAEVPRPEVAGQGGVDPIGGVDVAVRHPPPKGLGGHVDQLDLFGGADDLVGHGLPLLDAGDRFDDVVERFEVLHVDGGDDVDAGVEQFLDVLPSLLVPATGDVGVGELVDERHLRLPGQDCVEVHLLERGTAVGERAPGG